VITYVSCGTLRLGHLHYRDFPILRGLLQVFQSSKLSNKGVCKGCALGKNSKDTFPNNKSRSKGILDLIHSYVSGSMSVASL
jgi:hypothetical protein